ncbi:MAG: cation-translocating P-type ATPase [Simkaniaceae bacterium]|nr:cation-translocating P-type ATPase [Simkaniaceae bacterium]MCF7852800.1 cation-translocating P-type ATPase [Simkaniaceae bacterium]
MTQESYQYDEFFASGKEAMLSPFLNPSSRKIATNLSLKIALLSAGILALSFGLQYVHPSLSHLALIFVYFLSGTPALIESISDIKKLDINIDVLMTLAALFSVVIGSGLEGGLLLVLFALSHAMEDAVIHKTKGALNTLHKLSPTMVTVVLNEGKTREKSVREITKGEKVLIRAGEVIPLDGIVIEGNSYINLVHLTGESVPIPKKVGDEVQAGSMNFDGFLTIEVTKPPSESTLAKIIDLITKAQTAKPRLQKFLDRFGRPYAITIILLSAFFCLILPLLGIPWLGQEGSIYRSLAFLIAASPCALIIATPTAFLSAISACARKGILLKGGVTLDAFSTCSLIALDKTGTLTTGNLKLISIESIQDNAPLMTEEEAIGIAAALENKVVHPIARAITTYAQEKSLSHPPILHMKAIPGRGIEGIVEKKGEKIDVHIGSYEYVESTLTEALKPLFQQVEHKLKKEGHLITLMSIGSTLYLLHFQDEIRPNMEKIISDLHRHKLKTVMLTGDHSSNAQYVGKQLGMSQIYSDLKPDQKLALVSELSQKEHLAMVGDGINDAPALARSHVGISMGLIGSQTAIEASDIVFLNDDLSLLPWLTKKAHHTMHIVKQNLLLALIVIFFATTPALLGWIPLWLAVILHEGGTIVVGLNSLRLLRR